MLSTVAILVYRPVGSGVATYTTELANCLAGRKNVILFGYELSRAVLLSSDVIKVDLGNDPWIKDFILGGSDVHSVVSIGRTIRKKFGNLLRDAELLHFIQPTLSIGFSGNIVTSAWHYYDLSKGLVHFPSGMRKLYGLPVIFYVLQNYILEQVAYRRTKGVIATTTMGRDVLKSKGFNAFYVNLPVNVPDRGEVELEVGEKVRIMLGERDLDRPRNNVVTFLKAVANLSQIATKDFRVLLVGNVDPMGHVFAYYHKLRDMGVDIKILKRLPVNLFLNQLSRNDIYVSIRSIMDQGSYGVLQAMARGNMILASRSPAYADIVLDGENGLLVNEKSAIGISRALQRVIEDTAALRRFKQKSYELAKSKHSYDVVAPQLLDIYRKLVS